MAEIINVGPFMVNAKMVVLLGAIPIIFYILKWKLKHTKYEQIPLQDILINAVLLGVITWKVSPLFFNPLLIIENPFMFVSAVPSMTDAYLGMIVSVIYLSWKGSKLQIPYALLFDTLSVCINTALLFYHLLFWNYGKYTTLPWGISIENPIYKYHPVNIYYAIISTICLIQTWQESTYKLGNGQLFAFSLLSWGIGLFIISFFEFTTTFYFGLSLQQLIGLFIILVSVISNWVFRKISVST